MELPEIKPLWKSFVSVLASLPHTISPCGRPTLFRKSPVGVAEQRSFTLPIHLKLKIEREVVTVGQSQSLISWEVKSEVSLILLLRLLPEVQTQGET